MRSGDQQPQDGEERLKIEEKDGAYRVVKETYEHTTGWLYEDCVVVESKATISSLSDEVERVEQQCD